MYTAGELERASMALDKPMNGLEHRIMADIVRRIRENGDITAAADWQITRLVQLGMGMTEISAAINEALGAAEDITSTLFENVLKEGYVRDKSLYEAIGKVQIPFEENAPLQQLISAVTAQTNETMQNITQSLGFAQRGADGRISFTPIADYYQKTLDNAMYDISSGAFDYNTVLNRTVKEMTNSGLRTVDYATGWSNRVPVAARRAVMTGMNQLTAKVNEDNAEELNTEWFEISWHSGARPSHWWGGRWYTKEQLTTVCNLGDVTGLCGANCYHDYSPVIPGISVPMYTEEQLEQMNREEKEPIEWNGKKYTKYEATQRQRQLETTMRAQREEMALLEEGGADEDDLINCRARYNATSHEYAQFSDAMGIPQERERVYADGLGTKLMQGKTKGGSGKDSPVKVPAVGAHVTDTVTAEERKELLSRDKVVIADNAKTVEKVSAVELWETENYKNSTEKGLLILPDGTTKDFGGIEHHVTGKEEDIKLMDGATFTHNHPTDNTFSQNDIVTGLVKGNLKEMRAVTSTGDVHILVNNGATEQQRKKFNVDYQQRRMKAANVADAKIRRGEKINKDEYVKSRLETFMAEHAEEYNLSYSKTRIDVNKQSIDKSAKSDIIKAITIDDFNETDSKGVISKECKETIMNTLKEQGVSYVYDEIKIVNISRSADGKIEPLRTNAISSPSYPKIVLEVNEAAFGGRSKEQIDLMFKAQDYSVANSLEEAVVHESAHAKVIQDKTYANYEAINEELSGDRFKTPIKDRDDKKSLKDLAGGISKYAQKDGLECIAETHVKLRRGENVPKELKALHDEYIQ